MQQALIGCGLHCSYYLIVMLLQLQLKLYLCLKDSSLSIWGWGGKITYTEIPFPLKSSKSVQDLQTIFFFSHVMLQDADSNDKHVMSSTQANAITANPLQFPFSAHWLGQYHCNGITPYVPSSGRKLTTSKRLWLTYSVFITRPKVTCCGYKQTFCHSLKR